MCVSTCTLSSEITSVESHIASLLFQLPQSWWSSRRFPHHRHMQSVEHDILQKSINYSPSHLKIKGKNQEIIHPYTQILQNFSATFRAHPSETHTVPYPIHQIEIILGCHCYFKKKKKSIRTNESRCHSIDKRGFIFFPFSQRGLFIPFSDYIFQAQVAILHVDGDAVEFNEL